MLTFARARALRACRSTALAAVALALPLISFANVRPADAEGLVRIDGCIGTRHAINCSTIWAPLGDPNIRTVPQPDDPAVRARAVEEDRRWVDHCRPTIRQDRYGVARYHYTRPGCEFGGGAF